MLMALTSTWPGVFPSIRLGPCKCTSSSTPFNPSAHSILLLSPFVHWAGRNRCGHPNEKHSRTGAAVLGAHPDDHRADHDNHMDDDGSGASSSDGGSASESVVSDEDGVDAPSVEDLGVFAFLLAQVEAARDAPPYEEEVEEKLSDASSVNSDDCHSVCTEDVPVPDDVHRTPTDYSAPGPDSPEDVPPVPPPAEREEGAVPGDADDPMVAAAPVDGNRIWAVESVFFLGGGRIAYYRNNKFVAYCANRELHGHQCRLTRIVLGKRPGAGRPLGELKAWIDASFDFESGADHCRKCNFLLATGN